MMATRGLWGPVWASEACSALHQGGTTSGALPALPAPFREFSEGWRAKSASIKTAGFESGPEGNQPGSERQRQFLGISMRRGAIHARVQEPILYLQSGHGSGFAARSYIVPEDPRVLHETAQALRL
jgi:hypothetical protein